MLDLTTLTKVIKSLGTALAELKRKKDDVYLKDACIKRFEYTYELSHKMLRRQLEVMAATPIDIVQLSFQQLIRTAAERGLIYNSWDVWHKYREARNKTSHTYDEAIANEILADIPVFHKEAKYLLKQLNKHNEPKRHK